MVSICTVCIVIKITVRVPHSVCLCVSYFQRQWCLFHYVRNIMTVKSACLAPPVPVFPDIAVFCVAPPVAVFPDIAVFCLAPPVAVFPDIAVFCVAPAVAVFPDIAAFCLAPAVAVFQNIAVFCLAPPVAVFPDIAVLRILEFYVTPSTLVDRPDLICHYVSCPIFHAVLSNLFFIATYATRRISRVTVRCSNFRHAFFTLQPPFL
jgi:hypothetical protein